MSAAIAGFVLILVVSIAADFRLANALICLAKSTIGALNPIAKGKTND